MHKKHTSHHDHNRHPKTSTITCRTCHTRKCNLCIHPSFRDRARFVLHAGMKLERTLERVAVSPVSGKGYTLASAVATTAAAASVLRSSSAWPSFTQEPLLLKSFWSIVSGVVVCIPVDGVGGWVGGYSVGPWAYRVDQEKQGGWPVDHSIHAGAEILL